MKKFFKILPFIFICILGFQSCEEPDDPALPYEGSTTRSIGKTITSIDVFWEEALLDNFDRYEIYYRKYYEPEAKLYLTLPNQHQVYATISGLDPNTEYKIYVNAIDKNGKIYSSKEISERTFSDIPSMVEKFYVSDYSYNMATLLWSEYKDSYAVAFDRYELYYGTTADFICDSSTLAVSIEFSNIYSAIIPNLKDKSGYYFKLRIYNKLGKYREMPSVYLRTPNAPPLAVYLLPAEKITESSAIIRWRKSNDKEFSKYCVYVGNSIEGFRIAPSSLLVSINNVSDTCINVSGLTKGSAYIYKVVVYDEYLDYAVSKNFAGFHAYMNGIPPSCEISSIYAPEEKPDEIALEWYQSALQLFARYDVYCSTDSLDVVNNKGLSYTTTDSDKNYYSMKNLTSGKKYYFKTAVVDVFSKQAYSKIKGIYRP